MLATKKKSTLSLLNKKKLSNKTSIESKTCFLLGVAQNKKVSFLAFMLLTQQQKNKNKMNDFSFVTVAMISSFILERKKSIQGLL
jgi:hypothetical protein